MGASWVCWVLSALVVMVLGRQESESLIDRLNLGNETSAGVKDSVSWGLLDTTAIVGKLFEYPLPRTTLGNGVTKYAVSEAGSDRLPKWLSIDLQRNLIEGVPSSVDRGRLYYIEVTATSLFGVKQTTSKDIFVVSVQKEFVPSSADGTSSARPMRDRHGNATTTKPIVCATNGPVTIATVIVDTDLEETTGSERAWLLRRFGRHVDLPVTSLRLTSGGGGGEGGLDDQLALVAGPGNVVSPKHRHPGVLIQWVVGCGTVTTQSMRLLQRLEATALNGSLALELGSGITGWHVTKSRASGSGARRKRLVAHATATPLPTLRLPVGHPTATMVVLPTGDGAPQTRVVPSLASPVPSSSSEKPVHKTKTKIRHQSRSKHSRQTPGPSTRIPTDGEMEFSQVPPTQSSIVAVLPTRNEATEFPKVPATPKPPEFLESSLVFPIASIAATPTKPLTTTSTKIPTTPMITTTSARTPDVQVEVGRTSPLPTTAPLPVDRFNYSPIRKNSFGQLTASVGEMFQFTIPNDTFYDHEDGPTRNLELIFVTIDDLSMTPNSWIKFNSTSQTLYGMPLEEHSGKQDYILAAKDSAGHLEKYNFEIAIHRRFLDRKVNHEVKVVLGTNYDHFMMDVDRRIDVASKIARAIGDEGVVDVAVTRILEGSVEFYWTNLSLANDDPCPVESLRRLADLMIQDDGSIDPDFSGSLEPHEVQSVEFTPKGNCASRMNPVIGRRHEDLVDIPDVAETETDPHLAKSIDGLLMTTIIPILILVVVLALALVLICAVWTRKKKEDNHGGGGCEVTHSTRKGVPVIFADELDEKPSVPSKPLILADERPPVAPPDYDQATASNSPSTPRSCCNDPLIPGGAPQQQQQQQRPHHPPSTYGQRGGAHKRAGSGGGGGGTRVQLQHQSSRNPPPYVSS